MNPMDPPKPDAPQEPNPINPTPEPATPDAPPTVLAPPPEPIPQPQPTQPATISTPSPAEPQSSAPPTIVSGGDPAYMAPASSSKKGPPKLLFVIVAAILGVGLLVGGFFGFKAFAKSQNKKAAKTAANTFIEGYRTNDFNKVKSVYKGELSESDFAPGGEDIFESSELLDMVVGKKDGHDKAVVAYKLTLKKDSGLGLGQMYILLILHKENGKWMVEDGLPSITEPKANLDAEGSGMGAESEGANQDSDHDDERKDDLAQIQGGLETYASDNSGQYPTLAQMNDSAFRKSKLDIQDQGAFKDPEGSSDKLVGSPNVHVYAYKLEGRKYTLTATLDNGERYVVDNY